MIELCTCGWDIAGVDGLPAHQHVTYRLIRRERDGFEFEMRSHWLPQTGFTVLEERDEIALAIPWKRLAWELRAS